MNLNESPTIGQLQALVEACDHSKAHHVLWVSNNGDVQISVGPWDDANPPLADARLRYETFSQGSGNVGRDAASDTNHMTKLFSSLQEQWRNVGTGNDTVYVDQF